MTTPAPMAPRGDRAAFLGRVRARLRDGIPENHVRPVVPDGAPPPVAYAADDRDAAARFRSAAAALGAVVDDVPAGEAVRFAVAACTGRAARRVVVSRDPECAGVADALRDAGIEVVDAGDVHRSAEADIGITGAAFGIALTGSLVVDSTRAGARTASLLPAVHVALLARDAILPDPGALLRSLDAHLPDGLPSNLVLITGPSRSADIELQLTVGVHGPRELVIGLLGPRTGSRTAAGAR